MSLLRNNYLSWSQMNLWNKSKQQYIDKYVHGKEQFVTKEMKYGRLVAEALEYGKSDDPLIDLVVNMLPRHEYYEVPKTYHMDNHWEMDDGSVFDTRAILFGKIDAIDSDTVIHEYKTGKTPWTQYKVNDHGQLNFYACLFQDEIPGSIKTVLHWLPTKNSENKHGVELTGEHYEFERIFTEDEIADFMFCDIDHAVTEIRDYEHYQPNVITL